MLKLVSSRSAGSVGRFALLRRRVGWFLDGNISAERLANTALALAEYGARRERLFSLPPILKIDISPLCNLRCISCLHADKRFFEDTDKVMADQEFNGKQWMSVAQYSDIIDQVRGKSAAVSMYYCGDPLVHKDLDEMCRVTAEAGMNSHVSTNLSFKLSNDRIESIVRSGLTHLTVCVDGLSQQEYEQTRVGGRIGWVLDNLERICAMRNRLKRTFPRVEVQYIKFKHNLHELEKAQALLQRLGVDQVTAFWGALNVASATSVEMREVFGARPDTMFPRCTWPWTYMLIKYNGDVIPCCIHRVTSQYRRSKDVDPRILGNVFETSVVDVWNNHRYQETRRLVAKPSRIRTEPNLEESFCYSCTMLFETNVQAGRRTAAEYHIADVHPQLVTSKVAKQRRGLAESGESGEGS